MRGSVFRPGYPVSVSDLKDLVENANSGNARTLGGSVDTQSGESGPAYQPTTTQSSMLRIVKVTGTVTGGYSFTEVYDPDGDGAYTTSPYGINSVSTSVYLVAKSGVTFATNDLVVARLNPYHPHRWEGLCILAAGTGGGAITNALAFNTGTRVLTSTVSGVPATATIPAGGLSFQQITLGTTVILITSAITTPQTILTLSLVAGTYLVTYSVGYGAMNATSLPNYLVSSLYLGSTAVAGTLQHFAAAQVTGVQVDGCSSGSAIVGVVSTMNIDLCVGVFNLAAAAAAVVISNATPLDAGILTAVRIA